MNRLGGTRVPPIFREILEISEIEYIWLYPGPGYMLFCTRVQPNIVLPDDQSFTLLFCRNYLLTRARVYKLAVRTNYV